MSLITGETRATVEEWLALRRLGGPGDFRSLPARTVDGWLTLEVEREGLESKSDAN